jgi:hypothetical protein
MAFRFHSELILICSLFNNAVSTSDYYNSACCVWVWDLACNTEGETQAKVFENRMLKEILGSKGDQVTGE